MPDGGIGFFLVLFIITVVLSALFSASEAALLSVQRVKVQHMVNTGVTGAQRMAQMVEHPERFLPTILVGNNLVNSAAAALGTIMAVRLIDNEGVAAIAATVGVAIVLTIFGESAPKTVGSRLREGMALSITTPILWLERLLYPVVAPIQAMNRWVAARLGNVSAKDLAAQEELKVLISLGKDSGAMEETEAEMMLRMLRVTNLRVGSIMTPRTEIIYVEKGMPLSQFLEFNARQYHSRFPVYNGDVDDVVGLLAARDVLQALGKEQLNPDASVTHLMRPAHFVPETKPVSELLSEMREKGVPLALVVNEFGSVAGLVTFKQLVGEIVGELKENEEELEFKAVDEHTYAVKGGTRIDVLNEKLGLDLPMGDYTTIAGFVLSALGRIPEEGESVGYRALDLKVTKMRGPKVEEVLVQRSPAAEKAKH
ncbi:MAG: HlyC/CorC family transporter [SAR202 cluster bacterium]|nr:HlyC/CorC family transporter [SAR202 cluster bacterium]